MVALTGPLLCDTQTSKPLGSYSTTDHNMSLLLPGFAFLAFLSRLMTSSASALTTYPSTLRLSNQPQLKKKRDTQILLPEWADFLLTSFPHQITPALASSYMKLGRMHRQLLWIQTLTGRQLLLMIRNATTGLFSVWKLFAGGFTTGLCQQNKYGILFLFYTYTMVLNELHNTSPRV